MVTRERESFKLFRRREKNGRANILGIAGSTCTGKSTLSSELLQEVWNLFNIKVIRELLYSSEEMV
jgi:uridine kinase